MTLADSLPTIGSALAAVITGGWSVLQIYFRLKAKHAALEKRLNDDKVDRMSREIKKLTGIVDNLSNRLETNLKDFTSQMHTVNLNMVQTAGRFEKSISDTREGFIREIAAMSEKIAPLAERLALLAKVAEKLEEKYIGEGHYRIGPKGPKG